MTGPIEGRPLTPEGGRDTLVGMASATPPERPSEHPDERALIEHMISAQEMERRRIAAHLHDHPLQAMVAVALRIQLLTAQLPKESRANLEQLSDAVTTAVAQLRDLSFSLRPAALDYARLSFVLETYLDQLAEVWRANVRVRCDLHPEPPQYLALAVFRIVQRSLELARENATVTEVDLRVINADGGILTEVIDNGASGSDLRHSEDGEIAVHEMTARAKALGGWLRTGTGESGDGGGGGIRFWVPLSDSPATGGGG